MSEKIAPAPRPDMNNLVCALRNRAVEQGVASELAIEKNDLSYGFAWDKTNAAENELWRAIMKLDEQCAETQRGRDALQALCQNQLESIASLQKELESLKASLGNDSDSTEKIVAAAIRHGLVVFTGPHHHTIIRDIVGMGYAQRVGAGFDQGFLTSKGRYVDRPEATNIAIGAKQITVKKFDQTDLFSEELWEVRSHWEAPKEEGSQPLSNVVTPSPKTPEQVEAEDDQAWADYLFRENKHFVKAYPERKADFLAGRASLRNQVTAG